MAQRLAEVYSLDAEKARLAGLLHDWCKDVSGADLIDRAVALGIPVSDVDRAVPYLLHAPVAAAELSVEFPGISRDVLDAVGAHTYGSGTSRRLDGVYVADTLEPGVSRWRPGLRNCRTVSLEELLSGYADSIRHLLAVVGASPGTVATGTYVGGARR